MAVDLNEEDCNANLKQNGDGRTVLVLTGANRNRTGDINKGHWEAI